MNKIFGTGAMRSGGSLVCNILSLNKKNFILIDVLYFFRHMFFFLKKIDSKSLKKYSIDLSLRLKFKNDIIIDPKKLYVFLKKKGIKNVDQLHTYSFKFIYNKTKNQSVKNLVEYANGEWRNIDHFLKIRKSYKAFFILRDPRAVYSSFKKYSYARNNDYWYCIFNWLDSVQYINKIKSLYDKKRLLILRFEDIHNNPKENIKKILSFSNVNTGKFLTQNEWKKRLLHDEQFVNISAYNNKKSFGFSKKRINNWKNYISIEEIKTIEFFLHDEMRNYDYDLNYSGKRCSAVSKFITKLKKNNKLKVYIDKFFRSGKGSHKRPENPIYAKNWGVFRNGSKTNDKYLKYLNEKKSVQY